MDALAGLFDPDVAPDDVEPTLARMRRALELASPPVRAESVSACSAGCVLLDHRSQGGDPAIARDAERGLWLAFAGELFDHDDLRARLNGRVATAESAAELCLGAYCRDGADFVQRLNGHFSIVIFCERERRLSIATDPFGYRPMFLAQCGRRVLFASEMKAILAVLDTTPAVDGIGLLQLIRRGWPLGDRTWLETVRLAPPGAWLDVTAAGVTARRYFRLRFRRDDRSSLSSYVEGLAEHTRRTMRRVAGGCERVGLPLSGGLDSRTLLLAADAHAPPLLAYSFGRADSRDVRYAAQLARVAGVDHLQLTYAPGYLGRSLSPVVWRTEGLLSFSEATFTSLHFHDVLAERVDVLLYGHAGDALTGAHLPYRVMLWRSRQQLIDWVFRRSRRVPEAALQRVFSFDFWRRFAPTLREALAATFADIDQEGLADVLDVWDMENRQRRGIFASAVVDRSRFRVRAPFLDRDLVAHLCRAPLHWRLQQHAYKTMISTAFPSAAAVPWAHTASRVHAMRVADFAAQARGHLGRRIGATGAPANGRDLCADTRSDPQLAQVIREFAASPSFPSDIFDRQGIEATVLRHWGGSEDLTHLVTMLATVATAFRLLLWQPPRAVPAEALGSA